MPQYYCPYEYTTFNPEFFPSDVTLDSFTLGYIEALHFSLDAGEDDAPLSDEALERVVSDCNNFRYMMASQGLTSDLDDESVGADFWFTREGHGVGFWDDGRGHGEDYLELDKLATTFGETCPYKGDDGLLYFCSTSKFRHRTRFPETDNDIAHGSLTITL